jgi:hypothetical protein
MLREDQVQRYGRQILLKELGGRGQRRLLEAAVEVLGAGPGIAEAVAYLAAGGSPLRLPAGLALDGFLAGGSPAALSPDADAPAPVVVSLLPAHLSSEAASQVVVGGGVAWRGPGACPECWAATRAALPAVGAPVVVGSLAALAVQRLVLGWAEPVGLVRWSAGRFAVEHPPRCAAHRISE